MDFTKRDIMNDTLSLLCCPFCGGKPETIEFATSFGIYCSSDKCPCEDVYVNEATKKMAIAAWNTRTVSVIQ